MLLRRFGCCVILVSFACIAPAAAQDVPRPLVATTVGEADYPISALIAAEEGRTTLTLTVAPDGRVADAQIARTSGSASLDQAAARIAKARWRYQPAMRNGQPVTAIVMSDVVWTLPLRAASQAYVAGAGGPARGQQPPPAMMNAYPSIAMARGEQGVVGVRYTVGADGSIQNAELAAPSGYSSLDNAALRVVRGGGAQPGQQGVRDRLVAFALVPADAYGANLRCYAAPVLAHESVLYGGEEEFSHFSGLHGRMVMRWRMRPIHNWTALWVQVSQGGAIGDMLVETKNGWMQVPTETLRSVLARGRIYPGPAAGNCWYYDPVALMN